MPPSYNSPFLPRKVPVGRKRSPAPSAALGGPRSLVMMTMVRFRTRRSWISARSAHVSIDPGNHRRPRLVRRGPVLIGVGIQVRDLLTVAGNRHRKGDGQEEGPLAFRVDELLGSIDNHIRSILRLGSVPIAGQGKLVAIPPEGRGIKVERLLSSK